MNRLSTEKRAQIVAALVEGCSIRSTVRMTGASKNTIAKLLVELGAACSEYMDRTLRNLTCQRVQVDEIWSFVYAKQKNAKPEHFVGGGYAGDIWTWVAIDAQTKLVCSWMVGQRDPGTARDFMQDLSARLANRVQLTSDGLKTYLAAVDKAFGDGIDYAMLVKIYGDSSEGQKRYSPAECIGCDKRTIKGNPDQNHISTSYIERQNLTMRMSIRRFTRLTNAFSKKVENHVAAIAIHYMHYNFCRIHQTLRITPAMAAGITDHVWSLGKIISLTTLPPYRPNDNHLQGGYRHIR
jgi:IS1 family transposase